MSKRPIHSILLIAGGRIARGDFRRRSVKPAHFNRHEIDRDGDWTLALDHPAVSGAALARRVTLLTTGVESQLIGFPAASISQMSAVELNNALRFEIETLSGIEVEDLSIASVPAESPDPETQRYLVAYVRRSSLERVVRHLATAGVRYVELLHPAGFGLFRRYARELSSPAIEYIESWGSELYRYSRDSKKLKEIQRITAASAQTLAGKVALGLVLTTDTAENPLLPAMNLEETTSLQRWMAGVGHTLRMSRSQFPVIAPARREAFVDWRPVVALLLAGLTFAGCWMHRNWLIGHVEQVVRQAEELAEPGRQKQFHTLEQKELLEQQTGLELESGRVSESLMSLEFFFDRQSRRLFELFKLLSEFRTNDLVVREMHNDAEGMTLGGVSLNSDSAPLLANRLRPFVLPLGWNVSAATQEGEQKLVSGGPWAFQILLRNVGPFKNPPPGSIQLNSPVVQKQRQERKQQ